MFYFAAIKSFKVIALIIIWVILQSILALSGFYLFTDIIPPRFMWLVAPPMSLILYLFISTRGRAFIGSLDLKWLTIIHVIRIPVEIVLLCLYFAKKIPLLMTFEGGNFDILSGFSVFPIFYFAFRRKPKNKFLLFTWNCIALCLLINIMINGILSSPTKFQQFAFDQPNIAILHFPFNLLPSVIVPLVLFSHIASIWKLTKNK